ncbi:pinensin family lanthipeptide [Longimicrobium terrae]|uniref:Uncharacterized protein n=1 Tax=Longimicrobium terrae TaxID=1639882 RepID=A0A841GMU2_9BACT|nr:pinensin family lanthipeptide [Longimicrobium terrae]MBB4635553.1 hypothetical protein [Longimicrobium terrae]MBB6069947.1 hypothetical protein [Longimicrobium terrae]NNC32860.1 hypothetical protein [Longimicrobium terrae]
MTKIRLNLDNLTVESFATAPDAEGERGTVRGQGFYTEDIRTYCNGESYSMPQRCLCRTNEPETCVGSCNPEMCSFMDSTCCADTYLCE